MKINYNMSAIFANDYLRKSDQGLSISVEKLSSGYKVNHAKDNPSGIARLKKIHAQLRGLDASSQNASDAISVIDTAEGALTEVHDMLQRMNELSVKASNGTMSERDAATVQEEVNHLKEEITRIAKTTEFNGNILLDGSYDMKGFVVGYSDSCGVHANDSAIVRVETYSQSVSPGYYDVGVSAEKNPETGELEFKKVIISKAKTNPEFSTSGYDTDMILRNIDSPRMEDGKLKLTSEDDFSLTLQFDIDMIKEKVDNNIYSSATDYAAWFTLDLTAYGPMTMQVGANEGEIIDIWIPDVTSESLGVANLDLTTTASAKKSIDKISSAIDQVSSVRSRLANYQSRLEQKISSSDVTTESMTGAYSEIMDVDMAEEMTQYTQQQVLSQAGTSILAQANERPSQILQLLQ